MGNQSSRSLLRLNDIWEKNKGASPRCSDLAETDYHDCVHHPDSSKKVTATCKVTFSCEK